MKLVCLASMRLYCNHGTRVFGFKESYTVTMKLVSLALLRLYCNNEARVFGFNEAVL